MIYNYATASVSSLSVRWCFQFTPYATCLVCGQLIVAAASSKVNHSSVFTVCRHASVVYVVVVCLSACLSTLTSLWPAEKAKCTITQTTHDIPGTLLFWCRRSQQNSNRVTPNGGTKCRWHYNSKTSTVTSVNLVWLQVYHTERPPLFALCSTFDMTQRVVWVRKQQLALVQLSL